MADISQGIAGLLASAAPKSVSDINNETIQSQQIMQNGMNLHLQQQQRQAQIAALASRQKAIQEYINTPLDDPRRSQLFNNLMVLAPDLKDSAKQGYDAMTVDAQKQHLNDSSSMLGYAQAGDWDNGIKHINSIIDTDTAAKKPTAEDEAYRDLLIKAKNGDKQAAAQAINLAQLHTASILGPEKFAEAYPNLAKLPSEVAKSEADTAKTTAETNTLIPAQANQANAAAAKDQADANGEVKAIENPSSGEIDYYSNRKGPLTTDNQGNQSQFDQFTNQVLGTETNPDQPDNIKNPLSSATGRSQAVKDTWLEAIKQQFPEIAKGKSDAQILALRNDPNFSVQVGKEILKDKVGALSRMTDNQGKPLPINKATVAMAYKLGQGNAQKIISAVQAGKGDTPLTQLLDAKTIKANPQLAKETAMSYGTGLVNQFGTDPIQIGDPTGSGDQFLESLPKRMADQVKAIANGDIPAPTGKNGTTLMGSPLMQKVLQYDPTFNATRYAAKQALGNQATPEGKSLNAMNTLIGHLDEYAHLAQDRNAASGPLGNAIGNIASAATGGRVSKIVSRMNDLRNTIAGERARVLGIDDQEGRKDMGNLLDTSKDTDTLLKDIGQITQTTQDRVGAIFSQYQAQTGQKPDVNKFIYPSTQSKLQRIQQLANQREPNRGEISYLIANPNTAAQFDKTFGAGQAERYFKMSAH